ncbi:MAG: tyrosine--tRNA ligase [Chloroflexota bacterium]
MNALDVLRERGFVYQVSDEDGLRRAFEGQVTAYCGYDPTDESLTVGNLVSIMLLAHLQRLGHRPIALVGGGTGMIGDPSDKLAARPLLAVEQIDANVANFQRQLSRYLDFESGRALLVNNAEWLRPLGLIEFLRDIGRHFSVNAMLDLEFVRTRLASQAGLTYLEFSYILLQAYDYLELYRRYGCTLQVGGSDQWANILAGADLIRRLEGGRAYALVTPLITTASGRKLSKSEGMAVYLDPRKTSPYEYYQFWINTEDADVERYLALYTFLPMEEVRRLGRLQGADLRYAKEVLAWEATALTHGPEEADKAREASRAVFRGEAGPLDAVPAVPVPRDEIAAGIPLVDLLVRAGLAESKRMARPRIQQGAVTVNQERVTDERLVVDERYLMDGGILIGLGKRFRRVVAA